MYIVKSDLMNKAKSGARTYKALIKYSKNVFLLKYISFITQRHH